MIRRKGRSLADLKRVYITHIHIYTKRKNILKTEYYLRTRTLTRKIKIWKRAIKRLEKRRARLWELRRLVKEFTGGSLTKKIVRGDKKITKYLFYKYGLEMGISGKDLREETLAKRAGEPAEYRKEFTASFSKNKENLELWTRFKQFVTQNKKKP
jgi:hypothetical protein